MKSSPSRSINNLDGDDFIKATNNQEINMIHSMTAFARRAEQNQWCDAVWELRSVNHRYLEINIRLPDSLRELETAVREKIRHKLERGKVECFLKYHSHPDATQKISINKDLLLLSSYPFPLVTPKKNCRLRPRY